MPWFCRFVALGFVVLSLGGVGLGQQPPTTKSLDETGRVKSVAGNRLEFETAKSETWLLNIDPAVTKVTVGGTAELSYLRGGLAVRFSGEIDKKGALQAEVKEIEIFTPQGKNALGLFPDSSSDSKPLRNPEAGTYDIRGKLASFKDNELVLKIGGKTISGKVSEDVAIKVSVDDLNLAKTDDSVKVSAEYYDQQKPGPANGNKGEAMAKEITVTLSKPLSSKRKVAAKPTKPAKRKVDKKQPADATEEGGPLVVGNPFGINDAPADGAKKDKMADKDKEMMKDKDAADSK